MADKLDNMEQRELIHDDLEKQFQEVGAARTSAPVTLPRYAEVLLSRAQVLNGLSADGELATFKTEYQKVYSSLVQVSELRGVQHRLCPRFRRPLLLTLPFIRSRTGTSDGSAGR